MSEVEPSKVIISEDSAPKRKGVSGLVRKIGRAANRNRRVTLAVLVLFVAAGAGLFLQNGGFSSDTIKIGDTKITKGQVDEYAAYLTEYKKAHPAIGLNEDNDQFIIDRLVLNAALKLEAKKYKITVTDDEIAAVSPKTFADKGARSDYMKALQKSNDFAYKGMENTAYQAKLKDKLIQKKQLTMVNLLLDMPYYRTMPQGEVQAAYDKAEARMNNTFMPLIKSKATEKDIAAKADISVDDQGLASLVQIENTPGNQLGMYRNQGVVAVRNVADYQQGVTDFNDNDSKDWIRGDIGKTYKTNDKIDALKNVGDNTGVFASKAGGYMIFRLDGVSGGSYSSWDTFLNSYRKEHGKGVFKKVSTAATSAALGIANKTVGYVVLPGLEQAFAAAGCANSHPYRVSVVAWDTVQQHELTGAQLKITRNAGDSFDYSYLDSAGVRQRGTVGACGQVGTFTITSDSTSNPDANLSDPIGVHGDTFVDNCSNTPPSFSLGSVSGSITSDYTPVNSAVAARGNAIWIANQFDDDIRTTGAGGPYHEGFPNTPNDDDQTHIQPGNSNNTPYTVVLRFEPKDIDFATGSIAVNCPAQNVTLRVNAGMNKGGKYRITRDGAGIVIGPTSTSNNGTFTRSLAVSSGAVYRLEVQRAGTGSWDPVGSPSSSMCTPPTGGGTTSAPATCSIIRVKVPTLKEGGNETRVVATVKGIVVNELFNNDDPARFEFPRNYAKDDGNEVVLRYVPAAATTDINIFYQYRNGNNPDGSEKWDVYTNAADYTASLNCYNAECTVKLTGDAAGGTKVTPGGKIKATATIRNLNDTQLRGGLGPEPANRSRPANAPLAVQAVTGGNVAETNWTARINERIDRGVTKESAEFELTAPLTGSTATVVGRTVYQPVFFIGANCPTASLPIYQAPTVNIDGVGTCQVFEGWAYSPETPSESLDYKLYIDGTEDGGGKLISSPSPKPTGVDRPDVNAAKGITGIHGISETVPTRFRNGQDHTFYLYVYDRNGVNNPAPATYTMRGCAEYRIVAQAVGQKLAPTSEAPKSFEATGKFDVVYGDGSWGGPASGVPADFSYVYTKNGVNIGSAVKYPDTRIVGPSKSYAPPATPSTPIDPATAVAGDVYCLHTTATFSYGIVDADGRILAGPGQVSDSNPNACSTVHNKPFIKAYGASVSAGGDFKASGGTCTGGGAVGGWNDNISDPAVDRGSGAQFGVLSLLTVNGFASAQTSPIRSETALTFANTGAGVLYSADREDPQLGGKFAPAASTTHCLRSQNEVTSVAQEAPGTINIGAASFNGAHRYSGNITVAAAALAPGKNISLFVDGDIYISGNVTYQTVGWAKAADGTYNVPSLNLVSKTGNIYIKNDVGQLDGTYQAANSIYTCGTAAYRPVASSDVYGTCNHQLVVNGNFVAKDVKLMRSYGSLRDDGYGTTTNIVAVHCTLPLIAADLRITEAELDTFPISIINSYLRNFGSCRKRVTVTSPAVPPTGCNNSNGVPPVRSTCAAEIFQFSPEAYLAQPAVDPPSKGATQFDAITSLPPVL